MTKFLFVRVWFLYLCFFCFWDLVLRQFIFFLSLFIFDTNLGCHLDLFIYFLMKSAKNQTSNQWFTLQSSSQGFWRENASKRNAENTLKKLVIFASNSVWEKNHFELRYLSPRLQQIYSELKQTTMLEWSRNTKWICGRIILVFS